MLFLFVAESLLVVWVVVAVVADLMLLVGLGNVAILCVLNIYEPKHTHRIS